MGASSAEEVRTVDPAAADGEPGGAGASAGMPALRHTSVDSASGSASSAAVLAGVARRLSRGGVGGASGSGLTDEERRERAATRMQAVFRARAGRRRYTRVRRILLRFQATYRGTAVRKGNVLVAQKVIKQTRDVRKAAYRSAVSSGTLDWRLEALKRKHERISALGLGGVCIVILVNELVYADWKANILAMPEYFDAPVRGLRIALLISTVVLEALLIDYHRFYFFSAKQLFGGRPPLVDYARTVARDLIVCAIHPFIDGGAISSEQAWKIRTSSSAAGLRDTLGIQYVGIEDLFVIISVLMFLRVPLLVFRRLWLHSKAVRMKARFLARSSHIDLSLQLAIRVEMRDEGVRFLLWVGLVAVLCFGYVYYVLEREYAFLTRVDGADSYDAFVSPEFFMNSLWSNVIVLIGIGFDYPPQTYLGRAVLVLNAVWGLALFALMTAAFADALSLKDAELRLMHVVQRSEGVLRIQTAAVRVIQRAWKHTHHRQSVLHAIPRWARQRLTGAPLSPDVGARRAGANPPLAPAASGRFVFSRANALPDGSGKEDDEGTGGRFVFSRANAPPDGSGKEDDEGTGGRFVFSRANAPPDGSGKEDDEGTGVRAGGRPACSMLVSEAPSPIGTDRSFPDTPTRARRAAAVHAMRVSMLGAAESRVRKHVEGTHQKALMRALNDWRVERHRNATTSEMIENVTSVLKEVRERVDEQGAELSRLLLTVSLLAQHTLPDGAAARLPSTPLRRGARARAGAGAGAGAKHQSAAGSHAKRSPAPRRAAPTMLAGVGRAATSTISRPAASREPTERDGAGGLRGRGDSRTPQSKRVLSVNVAGAQGGHASAPLLGAGGRSATVAPVISAARADAPEVRASSGGCARRAFVISGVSARSAPAPSRAELAAAPPTGIGPTSRLSVSQGEARRTRIDPEGRGQGR